MKRTKYTPMKGADFTNEPALVDNDRAPICENIIPDHAGYPEKRPGWRVENEYEGKIYGLHKYTFGGVTKMLVHEGTRLWCEDTLLCEDMAENVSRSYQNEDDLIILDGQNYRVFKDNTGVAYGVPWLEQKENKIILDYHGTQKVSLVEKIFIGDSEYSAIDMNEAVFDTSASNYTAYESPADMSEFEMESRGYYVFIVEGERYLFYNDRQEKAEDGVPYFEKNGRFLTVIPNGSEVDYILCRYNLAPDKGMLESYAVKYTNEICDVIEMTEEGFYVYRIYYLLNNYVLKADYTFHNAPTKSKWKLENLSATSALGFVSSGSDCTEGGAYIPTTTISNSCMTGAFLDYDNSMAAVANGVAYEKVNKLTRYRRMTALGSGSTVTDAEGNSWSGGRYMLDGTVADDCVGKEIWYAKGNPGQHRLGRHIHDMIIFVNGKRYDKILSVGLADIDSYKAKIKDADYEWVVVRYAVVGGKKTSSYLVYIGDDSILPKVTGRDNIEIYYVAEADEDTDIAKCTVISEYDNALFVTGNPDKPNFDWHSYVENPYYFPDLNYQKFGDNTAVLGYVNTGEYQAIVKADGAAGGSIYIRSVAEFNGERAYPVKQMASGVGGVSKDGFCSLIGDDLILTRQGIFAFTTIDMTGEKTLSNRSWYVDGKLTKENLSNANMFVWQGKCMCAVEDRIYILNAESSMSRNHKYDTLYDCYFWTGVPMERVLVINDQLFFSNGCKVCRLNTDKDEKERYNDDGKPIIARWATKLDDDGDITRYKTMIKKGNTVTVKPYARSSAKVYVRTENDVEKEVKYGTADIFSWENIDFSRLTFLTSKTLREIIVNSKVKKYKRLQFIIENDALDEGFGVIEINKHFAYQNFIKR